MFRTLIVGSQSRLFIPGQEVDRWNACDGTHSASEGRVLQGSRAPCSYPGLGTALQRGAFGGRIGGRGRAGEFALVATARGAPTREPGAHPQGRLNGRL